MHRRSLGRWTSDTLRIEVALTWEPPRLADFLPFRYLARRSPTTMSHQPHETRSLTLHRMVAERFRQNPGFVIDFALKNLERWHRQGVDCDDYGVWRNLLQKHPEKLTSVLTGMSEEAIRLRQSSPFPGLIPESDRRRILAETE